MQTIQITENVTQLNRAHFVNAYLVREADGFTLIDTTFAGAAGQLIAAAHAQGGEIRRVALTHAHSDHAGSVDRLRERLGTGVEVLMGDLDARILAGEQIIDGKRKGSWAKLSTAPDTRLLGGERVGSLEVVASPGHTPGHVAFLDSRDGTLLAGDTFTSYWRTEVPNRMGQRFPLATLGTQDRALIIQSARSLRGLEPSRLLVGHGPAVPSPASAMDEAIARAAGH